MNDRDENDSSLLMKLYLRANQSTYAIIAFPIGTVLSIAPLFLYINREVAIVDIGYFMCAGEFLGTIAMELAEASEDGFVFHRPYDLYFINVSLALSLIMIPVWSEELKYLSCVFMMLVQTFNSASKPVVGESIHRLAVLTDREPNIVFAQANMWRRVGNATIGGSTPLIYAAFPELSFYGVGGIMLGFLCACMAIDFKIKETFEATEADLVMEDGEMRQGDEANTPKRVRYSTISRLKSYERRMEADKVKPDDASMSLGNITEGLQAIDKYETNFAEQSLTVGEIGEQWDESKRKRDKVKPTTTVSATDESSKTLEDRFSYFLIVYLFPFWDALISRLPFGFLTIAVYDTFGKIIIVSVILFGYQIGRAVSQFIQVWKCDRTINYVLNGVAFVSYAALVAYIEIDDDGKMWFIPLLFTGSAETLAIQQLYLMGLFGTADDDNASLRNAVKKSHTGTGIGSAVAFLAASQVFSHFGVQGIAYLGFGIMVAKIVTNLLIDYLHHRKQKKEKRPAMLSQNYSNLFQSMLITDV